MIEAPKLAAPKAASARPNMAAVVAACCVIAAPFVVVFEGKMNIGYEDPIGIVTSCVGHTGPDAVLGRKYTDQECAAQLQGDLLKHSQAVNACITVDAPLKTRAAFVSFGFNVGSTAFCTSTAARKLNAGDTAGACAELSRWTRAGGRVLSGLVRRRAVERKLCEEGLAGR